MIAEAFIAFVDFGNICRIVAGVVLGLVLVVFAVASAESSIGPLPFFGFALFFFIGLGIVFPHMSTVYRCPNLRQLDGEYRFAPAVIRKDKHGGESTDYVAIRPENLSGICQTAILVS